MLQLAPSSIRRREFLLTAGSSALGVRTWRENQSPEPHRVKLGVIGLGHRGFAPIPGFQTVAVGDLSAADKILADRSVDAVWLAAPAAIQANLTIRACQAGKDVYVEPPVFAQLDEGARIVEAARRWHRTVQVGATMRSVAEFQRAREIVKSGELGEVVFCRVFGGDDPMPPIDLVQFLFQEPEPVSLDAQAGAGRVEITIRFPGLVVSYQSAPGPWSVTIHGTKATLTLDQFGTHEGARHEAHWRDFLECIRTRRRPAGDIEACARSAAICLRAELAMRHNWVSG